MQQGKGIRYERKSFREFPDLLEVLFVTRTFAVPFDAGGDERL